MKEFNETVERGSTGFPFALYQQAGAVSGYCITPLQYHDDIEIVQPLSGVTRLVIEGEVIDAEPGTVYWINPGEVHAMYVGEDCRYRSFVFPKKLLALSPDSIVSTRLIEPLFSGQLRLPRSLVSPFAEQLLGEIAELSAEEDAAAPMIIADLLRLFGLLERGGLLQLGVRAPVQDQPIRRAIDFMQAHYAERITLEEIAACAGMNAKYFCSYFKKHTYTTPITYLNSLRIGKAKQALRSTNRSVLEIALSCGFENVSFFIRQFKKANGITPGAFRK